MKDPIGKQCPCEGSRDEMTGRCFEGCPWFVEKEGLCYTQVVVSLLRGILVALKTK